MNAKVLLPTVLAASALAAAPALAHKPDTTGQGNAPAAKRHGNSDAAKAKRDAKRCTPHTIAYIADGTLTAVPTLTKNADGTYDGTVSVAVTRVNHHAKGAKGTTQTFTLDNSRVQFGGPDRNNDGTVDAADLAANDRVKVTGRVTTLRKRCDTTGFTPTVTVKKVRFSEPKAA